MIRCFGKDDYNSTIEDFLLDLSNRRFEKIVIYDYSMSFKISLNLFGLDYSSNDQKRVFWLFYDFLVSLYRDHHHPNDITFVLCKSNNYRYFRVDGLDNPDRSDSPYTYCPHFSWVRTKKRSTK